MDLLVVLARDFTDAEFVGRDERLAVGNPLGDPRAVVGLVWEGAHLEHPPLVLVSNQQRLAGRVVTILVDQLAHQSDGLACAPAALERHPREL